MPAPGDQHHNAGGKAIGNPFDDTKPQISPYTAAEIATLQSRLEKQLGPEYISSRAGPSNQKVHYLAAEKCIQLANEVFGFNGWSSQIMDIQVDFVDENPQTFKVSLGLSVIVRVTLRDGTYHEDIGYGHMENCKGKAAAFEKAKKEGTTDGLKRALKNFGNVLGNCLYDKDYLKNVTKMKVGSARWNPEALHRHATYAAAKKEPELKHLDDKSQIEEKSQVSHGGPSLSTEDTLEDEFGDFDDADFSVADPEIFNPDEVVLPEAPAVASHHFNNARNPNVSSNTGNQNQNRVPASRPQPRAPVVRPQNGQPANNNIPPQPQTPNSGFTRSNSGANQTMRPPQETNAQAQSRPMPPPQPVLTAVAGRVLNQPSRNGPPSAPVSPARTSKPSSNDNDASTASLPAPGQGFFSARGLNSLGDPPPVTEGSAPAPLPSHLPTFNPNAESPSIRKTPGVDHKSSKPLTRDLKVAPASSQTAASSPRANVVNPQLDGTRRVGQPGGMNPSPLANRGGFRAPSKRPVDSRAALSELTRNGSVGADAGGGGDVKRQKVGG